MALPFDADGDGGDDDGIDDGVNVGDGNDDGGHPAWAQCTLWPKIALPLIVSWNQIVAQIWSKSTLNTNWSLENFYLHN